MTISGVIFDRDLTLLTLEPGRIAVLERYLQQLAASLRFREIFGLLERWDGYLPATAADEPRLWQELAWRLAIHHGLNNGAVDRLIELLAPYDAYFMAFPDAAPTLHTLRDAGYALALFTNSPLPSVDCTLRTAELSPALFAVCESRASLRLAKPDPRVFLELAERLGVPPQDCVVIDDQLDHVACVREIGMLGLHLQRNAATAEPNAIRSLAEIPERLRLLERESAL